MKKISALMAAFLSVYGFAQNVTKTYTASTATIANPERGFYQHEETFASSYGALSQSTLTNYRTSNKQTLILRLWYLDSFVSSSISSSFLTAMQTDFTRMRTAGIKCIIRFAYSDDVSNGQMQDATKAQVLAHIAQLKPVLLANGDVIAAVQMGFIGTWGEGYYTDHFGNPPTATDFQNRKDVLTALQNALPDGTMVMVRTPALKKNMLGTTSALSLTQAFTNTTAARTGHHNDCFLASADDEGTYDNLTADYAYLQQETKYVPMGGESCAVNVPRSQCPTALQELAMFHWSYMNLDYHPQVIAGFQSGGCFSDIENKLGYRFQLTSATFPQTAAVGGIVPISLQVANVGFASPFNQRTAYLVFRNVSTSQEFKVAINSDPRFWSAGATTNVSDNITLPTEMPAGNYALFLSLPDKDAGLSTRPEYAIQFANTNMWEASTGYNNLNHTITVNAALGINDNEIKQNLVIYPVPTNDHLVMEMQNISDYQIAVYNALGQRVNVESKADSSDQVTLTTSNLSNGIYFVSVADGKNKVTKQIVVGH
jgi:hypothetical protein